MRCFWRFFWAGGQPGGQPRGQPKTTGAKEAWAGGQPGGQPRGQPKDNQGWGRRKEGAGRDTLKSKNPNQRFGNNFSFRVSGGGREEEEEEEEEILFLRFAQTSELSGPLLKKPTI